MARPVPQDAASALALLTADVRRLRTHTHPGVVVDPETITGSRADTASMIEQILAALDAAGILIDETTE